jgi:hypothetical protein
MQPWKQAKNYSEDGSNKTFLFFAISGAGDIVRHKDRRIRHRRRWDPFFSVGDGGFRKSELIDGWVLVPPTEKKGKSNGRTRDQLSIETEKFYT